MWALCDAHNGYLYNLEVYCRATPGATEHGLGASVVRNLFQTLLEKATRVWDMSTLIRRCENFGLFYSFCSQLAEASERQT